MFKPYPGILRKQKMSGEARRAYIIFDSISQRSKRFGYAKPTFGPREFIGWWVYHIKNFKGTRPSAGRIDHSRGYSFDNIEMQDMKDNTAEMVRRCQPGRRARMLQSKKVLVYIKDTDVLTGQFRSIGAAADFFKMNTGNMSNLIVGRRKNSRVPFDFKVVV